MLGDAEVRTLVESYVDAWERQDVDAVVSMLSEDAAFAMPPLQHLVPGSRLDRGLPRRPAALGRLALADRPGSRQRPGGARLLHLVTGGGRLPSASRSTS